MSDSWKRLVGPDLMAGIDALVEVVAERVAERVLDQIGGSAKPGVERLGYSVDEAAAALGMSTSTVRERIKDETIRAGHVGGRVIIHRRELDRLLLGDDEVAS